MYPYTIEKYIAMVQDRDQKIKRLETAYKELADSYIKCMAIKCPANLMTAGLNELMKKIE